ncbi:unnamed protein product [Leptidea sinapis]|uniref:Ionotropic glutamate receptor C-terminal domain-containing protein n=1 Tax=Leptidea sinapis TaxID=189913 RepID=A0A5E4PMC9_9NEOP|nr:unnamed protein product [Leptidea sinapis]
MAQRFRKVESIYIRVEIIHIIARVISAYKSHVHNKQWNMEIYGKWSPAKGLLIKKEMHTTISMRRRNVNGILIAAPIVTSTNLTHEEMMSLRVSLFTDTWGYYKNGSYNGMVGHLINGEAELAAIFIVPEQSLYTALQANGLDLYCLSYYIAVNIAICQFVLGKCKLDQTVLRPDMSEIIIMVLSAISQQGTTTEMKEPVRKAMYETKVAPPGKKPNFFSLEEGVKKMQSKPFAFNMNLGIGYRMVEAYFREDEKCGLQEIQFLLQAVAWQTCRKNSAYKEIFKIGLYRNQEFGFNDHANRLIYRKKPTCAFTGSSFDSVNMIDFYPVLLLLAYGIFLAIIILFLELLYKRNRNKN